MPAEQEHLRKLQPCSFPLHALPQPTPHQAPATVVPQLLLMSTLMQVLVYSRKGLVLQDTTFTVVAAPYSLLLLLLPLCEASSVHVGDDALKEGAQATAYDLRRRCN